MITSKVKDCFRYSLYPGRTVLQKQDYVLMRDTVIILYFYVRLLFLKASEWYSINSQSH